MDPKEKKAAMRLRRDTRAATLLAVFTRLSGYGCAAGAVACFLRSQPIWAAVLLFLGCLIIAAGASGAELIDLKARKAKKAAARAARNDPTGSVTPENPHSDLSAEQKAEQP